MNLFKHLELVMDMRDLDNLSNDDIQKLIAHLEKQMKWWQDLGVYVPPEAVKKYSANQVKMYEKCIQELRERIKT